MTTDAIEKRAHRFARAAVDRLGAVAAGWLDATIAVDVLATSLTDALSKTVDIERAARWREKCLVEDTTAENYLSQIVNVDAGEALIEIRFKGMDVACPFVEIVAHDGVDLSAAALKEVRAQAKKSFGVFEPFPLGLSLASEATLPPNTRFDQETVAGHTSELAAKDPPSTTNALTLHRMRASDAADENAPPKSYSKFKAIFQAFTDDNATLRDELWLPDPGTFGTLVAEGHAYDVVIDEEWAGVIIAKAADFMGGPGWLIHEEILAKAFRGRHFAPRMQFELVKLLDADRPGVLHGTIHHLNTASLRTAKRVGRQTVQRHIFIDEAR